MVRRGNHTPTPIGVPDLFTEAPGQFLSQRLSALQWPAASHFPVNHAAQKVRSVVPVDLLTSDSPLLVAGFSAIGELVDMVSRWGSHTEGGTFRIALGAEPFTTSRRSFAAPEVAFTDQAREFWLEHGISVRQSGRILRVMDLLDQGRLQVRAVAGEWNMHAKVYVGDAAATVGSSNFTANGLGAQIEANARFERTSDRQRYDSVMQIAGNYWDVGSDWGQDFRQLLDDLLRFVTWEEALARACADLLEGEWAQKYLPGSVARGQLWPSQVAGIAQALWVIDDVGSVLVADATGSGKTRMGAHLTRSVRDRLYQTGRVRSDLAVLVAPPAVQETWEREAISCGLALKVISHGKLSRATEALEDTAVKDAQILALDESHNFLNKATKRTQKVTGNAADHVLLFTATPISRGAQDLLSLVQLLGPDNFEDETIDTLRELERRKDKVLAHAQHEKLRREIRRFTVRRTKRMLNELVADDPESYRDPDTGRVNRYPDHKPDVYDTSETAQDQMWAGRIRQHAHNLKGLVNLGRRLQRPVATAGNVTDEAVLRYRLGAASGLAAHHVFDAMRSSRAALIEHIAGTQTARDFEGISEHFKNADTGNMLTTVAGLARPQVELDCVLPEWLSDEEAWIQACAEERRVFQAILDCARQLSRSREEGKAGHIALVAREHDRVIAFDRHPITLAVLKPLVAEAGGREVLLATGSGKTGKKGVGRALARGATGNAIALCSDALNEGLNLQGASAIIHLDLPTTLRAAEQRVGRVDRMDSPYDTINSFWPRDGTAFATRAAERLTARAVTTEKLLGSNLDIPDLNHTTADEIVSVDQIVHEVAEANEMPWDGILDALEPVRALVSGPDALIPRPVYHEHRHTRQRIVSRVSPVAAASPWMFIAVAGTQHGAPHWMLLESNPRHDWRQLDDVASRLRILLADDPPARTFDADCDHHLGQFLARAAELEHQMIPRRLAKAIEQMRHLTSRWRNNELGHGHDSRARRWERLEAFTRPRPDGSNADPYRIGQAWFDLVTPHLVDYRRSHRTHLARLADITPRLVQHPLELEAVETAMTGIPDVPDIETRISACILGVPTEP